MTRSLAQIQREVTDRLREVAPHSAKLGRPSLTGPEADLGFQIAASFHAREAAGAAQGAETGAGATKVVDGPSRPSTGVSEPKWVAVARALIGTKEIPGPGNNPIIVGFWQRLGARWLKSDLDPWCGGLIAHCMHAAGLPYPKEYPRAASWATYGVALGKAVYGAIGVKRRRGGNHVFFIVGETEDKRFFKALGGNQGDQVSIVDIPKSEVYAIRWPAGVPVRMDPLPVKRAGDSVVYKP